MRFIIVPDLHYLQDNHSSSTDENIVIGDGPPTKPEGYAERLDLLINVLKEEKTKGMNFFISNGDLVHDDPSYLQTIKNKFDEVGVPYYVTYGNHDRATEQQWYDVWGYNRNTDFAFGDYAFILPNTSNEVGARLPADHEWAEQKLDQYADKKGIFMVAHVPQTTRWRNSADAIAVRNVLKQAKNFIGSIHSHVHGAITTERIDDLIFSMTGHFAHYGRNFYSIRRFEVIEDGIISELYDVTNKRVVAKQKIELEGNYWKWYDYSMPNNFVNPDNFLEPIFTREI